MGGKSGALSLRCLVRLCRTWHVKTLNSSTRFRQDAAALRPVTNRVYAKTVNELRL
jgi:hypothetical protein